MNVTQDKQNQIVISGLGLCSALGRDVVQSCASARAGLTRAVPIEHFWVSDEEGCGETEAIGHPAFWLTFGFSGKGRLARLGASALKNLLDGHDFSDDAWRQTAIILNQGSGYYFSAAARKTLGLSLDELSLPVDLELLDETITPRPPVLAQILELCNIGVSPKRQETIYEDQAGLGSALLRARQLLLQGDVKRCIIGGVDSYVDTPMLDALSTLGLLKSPAQQQGMMPGEAGAFILMEQIGSTTNSTSSVLATVNSVVVEADDHSAFSASPGNSPALVKAIQSAIDRSGLAAEEYGLVIGGMNGTDIAATEWGMAALRLGRVLMNTRQWSPAEMFGDIGAALGFASLCLTAQAFTRRYANTDNVLIWLAAASGKKTAVCVQKP